MPTVFAALVFGIALCGEAVTGRDLPSHWSKNTLATGQRLSAVRVQRGEGPHEAALDQIVGITALIVPTDSSHRHDGVKRAD
jgi:hypothetical protein